MTYTAATLLRQTRQHEMLSQQQVADLAGTTQSAVSDIEACSNVGVNTLERMLNAMGYELVLSVRPLGG